MTYEFINEVYNGVRTKGGTHNYSGVAVPTTVGNSPNVTAAQLRQVSPAAFNAYTEFGANSSVACQRDYCYYKMTNSNLTNGILQKNIHEKLYRFKLNYNTIARYADDSGDPRKNIIDSVSWYYKGNNSLEEQTPDELSSKGSEKIDMDFFTDGNLEIVMTCIFQESPGQTMQIPFYFTLDPSDLFEFKCVKYNYLHASFWRKAKYTYIFEKKNVVAKWYYPENNIYFFNWGLGSKSSTFYIDIKEQDSGNTITTTRSHAFTFSSNATGQLGNNEIKFTAGLGNTSTTTDQVALVHQENSDQVGCPVISYSEDIVLNRIINDVDTLYTLRNYDNNAISICVLPAQMY